MKFPETSPDFQPGGEFEPAAAGITIENEINFRHNILVRKKQKTPKKITADWLRKIGVPGALIIGIIFASTLGVKNLEKLGPDYLNNTTVFPPSGMVREVIDGDTFRLENGLDYRLISINAPDRGNQLDVEAKAVLSKLVKDERVWLEYDRYQNDKYGRVLVWAWIGCERPPTFLPANYMHLSGNQSRPGLTENPRGCAKGLLAQEELIRLGLATIINYSDQGPSKYEARLENAALSRQGRE